MTDLASPISVPRRSRRKAQPPRPRRRLPWGRIIFLILLLTALAAAIGYGAWRAVPILQDALEKASAHTPAFPTGPSRGSVLPFTPVQYLRAGTVGEQHLQVALGPAENGARQVALVVGGDGTFHQKGPIQHLPDLDYAVLDLPRQANLLVGRRQLPVGSPVPGARLDNTPVITAQGGEWFFQAWTIDGTTGALRDADYYALAAPLEAPAPTSILVNKKLNALWYYEGGNLVYAFRVGTGKHLSGPHPTAQNASRNHLTPAGWYLIANRSEGAIAYGREKLPAGDPKSPITGHWLGFSPYTGDPGLTWGIHATNRLDEIGRWVTDGSIRLAPADAERLFSRVEVGTTLVIQETE